MSEEEDLLQEIIAGRSRRNPAFESMVEAAASRRRMVRELAEARKEAGLSQTAVAAVMNTSQSSVARIEAAKGDVRLSTLERYAATLGRRIEWSLRPAGKRPRKATA